jgi:tellurite resistance protein TerC
MLGEHWINQWVEKTTQVFISLGVILLCIAGSIFYSIFMEKKGLPPEFDDDSN